MRLWTFQATASVEELKKDGILIAKWSRYPKDDPWTKAYRWMAAQMEFSGIRCNGNAPIWAWHSCRGYGKSPTLDDARNLLCDLELEAGIQTIELECPDELASLTSYSTWNMIADKFMDKSPVTNISPLQVVAMWNVNPSSMKKYDAIQATLPYIKQEWIVDIRPLNLNVGDFEYDMEEFV